MRPRSLTFPALALAALGAGAGLGAQPPARPTDRTAGHAVPLAATRRATVAPATATLAGAAMRGDLTTVRQLIARGDDINAPQGDGMTALHWAAERGDSAMVAALLRARAQVRARTRIGAYTPLHLAARTGNPGTVRALLAAASEVKATTTSGATALHLAAAAGNADVVRALLAKGAEPNARESLWGQTPLVFAAERDQAAAITALLAGGADPSIRTRLINLNDQAARQQAAEKKRNAVLISFEPPARHDSADADYKRALAAARAAAPAAARPATPATPGADTGAASRDPAALVTNAQGRNFAQRLPVREPRGPFTPEQIQAAIDSGRMVLLAPVIATDSVREQVDTVNGGVPGYMKQVGGVGGLTALHHAARQGSVAAALALVQGGAGINDTSLIDRMTPLLLATVNGQLDVAIRLAERGADPNVATSYGMTPLYATINAQWAPKSRYPQPQAIQTQKTSYIDVVQALLAKGANPNARLAKQPWWFAYNNCGSANCGLEVIDGTTPFWRAAYSLDVDAMRLLKKHGASDTTPSLPPRPAARGAAGATAATAGAARPDSGARARPDTATVAARRVEPPAPPTPTSAHPSAGANAPSMTPNTVPAPTAPVAAAPTTAAPTAATPATPTPAVRAAAAGASAGAGAQGFGDPQFKLDPAVAAAARVAPVGVGVYPVHAAAGVGYGNGFAGNSHRHAPDAWMPAMRYLVEELKADVNARDNNGYTPLHHAAARGDNEMILYLVSRGADVKAVSRNGRTVVDMANGPVQRLRPYPETIALLEKLGAKNQHNCVSC